MSTKNSKESKARPFPWLCADCFTKTVVPAVMDYTAKVKQDGVVYELHLPSVEVPRCQTCGETYSTTVLDDLVSDALRTRLRLLTPAQMRKGIEKLGLKQQELAERLGVAPETISRWVTGFLIQSRASDNLMRVYFALPEVRDVLRGAKQDPNLGTDVQTVHPPKPQAPRPSLATAFEFVFQSRTVRERAKQTTSPTWDPFPVEKN